MEKTTTKSKKEDYLPSFQWRLGRIISTYPGNGGIVRVVRVKITKGDCHRSMQKIAPRPIQQTEENKKEFATSQFLYKHFAKHIIFRFKLI